MRLIGLFTITLLLSLTCLGQGTATLSAATQALDRGDAPSAARLAGALVLAHPNDVRARVVLARAAILLGKLDAAFAELQAAARLDGSNADAWYFLARVSNMLSQREYERVFSLAPDSARAHQLMGEVYAAQNKQAESEREYQLAAKANPASVPVLVALGDLKRSRGDFAGAVEQYESAARIDAASFDAHYGLGACYLRMLRFDDAAAELREALKIDGSSDAARFALGLTHLRAGAISAAIQELEQVAAHTSGTKELYALLGQAYRRANRPADAGRAFETARKLSVQEQETRQSLLESNDPLLRVPDAPATEPKP